MVSVSGCNNVTISNIIRGTYSSAESNHGKPVYRKDNATGSVIVLIYYWDERDGPSFNGWWFGPKVGGDQVWAYNPTKTSQLPPTTGWQVPWDGAVDATLALSYGAGAAAAVGGGKGLPRPLAPRPHATQSKQLEEMKKREEEQKKRQEDLKARREAEEKTRKEQAATLAVRKAIQRVRTATPETYDDLRATLEETQANNLEAMGSMAEKVSEEATRALEEAQRRIDEIHNKRVAEEQKKQEQEKLKKEMEVKVEAFIKETKEEGAAMLAKVKETEALVEKLKQPEGSPEEIVAAAESAEKAVEETREGARTTRAKIMEKQKELADAESFRKVKREILELVSRLAAGVRLMERSETVVKSALARAEKKTAALQKLAERDREFAEFDKDKDGKLNRREVELYCKVKLSHQLPKDVLDLILSKLEPLTSDKFRPMHQKLFIAQSELLARQKAAEEEERQRKLEEERKAAQAALAEVSSLYTTAEASAAEAENKARPLIKESDKASDEIVAEADEAEALASRAEQELQTASAKHGEQKESLEENPNLKANAQQELQRLDQREKSLKGRLSKIVAAVKLAKEKAKRKAFAEFDQKRTECATAIRAKMNAEAKTADQFFEEINSASALTEEVFASFLNGLDGLELFDGHAEKLFSNMAGEAGEISKEGFKELVRVFYKCVKATVMSEEMSIKSKTIRRLEVGEVLEALEGPTMEEATKVKRLRCLATQDECMGWVTLAGNQGTSFLEAGGNFYTCVKETLITDGLCVQDSKTVRRLAKGEVVEVLEFQKKDATADVRRIKGKAKQDGAIGWITIASNAGTTFLEPC